MPMLRAVATDGHRMARAEAPAPEGAGGMPGIIVPRKTVAEVQKLLDGVEGDVTVELSDTKIRFTVGGVVLLSQADRGHLPRLRAGDPEEQRQEDERRQGDLRHRRRPRLHHRLGARRQGGQALAPATASWNCPSPIPTTARRARNWRSISRPTASRSASTPATCSTSSARSARKTPSSCSTMPARRRWCKEDGEARALYVLMPMRV